MVSCRVRMKLFGSPEIIGVGRGFGKWFRGKEPGASVLPPLTSPKAWAGIRSPKPYDLRPTQTGDTRTPSSSLKGDPTPPAQRRCADREVHRANPRRISSVAGAFEVDVWEFDHLIGHSSRRRRKSVGVDDGSVSGGVSWTRLLTRGPNRCRDTSPIGSSMPW
jgi:hypothetical protein